MTGRARRTPLTTEEAQDGAIRVGSLADLEVIETEVELIRPGDNRRLLVPIRSLTQTQLLDIRRRMTWPTPPSILQRTGPGNRPQLVFDHNDATYTTQMEAANTEYSERVLLAALQIEIPGANEEERLAALRTRLGAWATAGLARALSLLHGVRQEELDEALKRSTPAGG